jgi:RpiB/LacA/LacB family sugar-phosphate isomerase
MIDCMVDGIEASHPSPAQIDEFILGWRQLLDTMKPLGGGPRPDVAIAINSVFIRLKPDDGLSYVVRGTAYLRTGEAVVWYYKNQKGEIEIFDLMGFHPETGEELVPITKEVVSLWQEQSKRRPPRQVDLKSYELFDPLTGESRVWKVLDFGVSRYEAAGNTMTQGALVGTPSYMSPEQVRLESVDHRSDLYSLANVIYRTLTGKPAFVGDDIVGVLFHVVHTPPPQPSAIVRLPDDVELVLAIAMAKSPADRFQKAEELADAFRLAAKGDPSRFPLEAPMLHTKTLEMSFSGIKTRIAQLVASRITPGTFGLLVCGTGAGMQISANRNRFVRAVVIHDVLTAKMARAHNDANVACFGSRVTAPELAIELLAVFLQTPFAGGRHADRVAMLSAPAGTEELA